MRTISKYSVLILAFASISLLANDFNKTLRFKSLDIKDGFLHNTITCVLQDSAGFVWFGSRYGLQRFDGVAIKPYINNLKPVNKDLTNSIIDLALYGNSLLLATESGLQYFDIAKEKYIELNIAGQHNGQIDFIEVNKKNGDFYAVIQRKIYLIEVNNRYNCTFKAFDQLTNRYPKRLQNKQLKAMAFDREGNLFLGANNGMYLFSSTGKPNTPFVFQKKISDQTVNDIVLYDTILYTLYANNRVLAYKHFTAESGYKFELINEVDIENILQRNNFDVSQKSPNTLVVDHNMHLWCGSPHGLYHIVNFFSPTVKASVYFQSPDNRYTLNRSQIKDLFIDKSNCLWIGTYEGGVNYLNIDINEFNYIPLSGKSLENEQLGFQTRAIFQNKNKELFIGSSNNGFSILTPDYKNIKFNIRATGSSNSLTRDWVSCLDTINGRYVLLGTLHGLCILDLNTQKIEYLYHGPDNSDHFPRISDMVIDKNDNIWVASRAFGLFQLIKQPNGYKTFHYNTNDTSKIVISSNFVNYLYYDTAKNEILAGTLEGLNRIIIDEDGTPFTNVYYTVNDTSEKSLSSNYIWMIDKSADNEYWLGTIGGGLNKISFKNKIYKGNLGAYEAKVYQDFGGMRIIDVDNVVVEKSKKKVWFTANGIYSIDIANDTWKRYDNYDGLQEEKFLAGSAYQSSEGEIFLGGISGITYFKPSEITSNEILPKIALSELKINNMTIVPGDTINGRPILSERLNNATEINLKHNENDFTLEFASLHFANPDKNIYRYRLLGYDDNWKSTTNKYPFANYSNLKYGSYVFEVLATNNDGLWAKQPRKLKINILPPWWRSKWAYAVYLVLFMTIAFATYYLVYRWAKMNHQLRFNEEVHQMKLRFFTNISHELRTPLTLILSPLEDLLQKKVPDGLLMNTYKTMHKHTNRLLNLINELMDFRKVETGVDKLKASYNDINDFVKNIATQFDLLARKKQIRYEIVPADSKIEIWFDTAKVEKVIYNLLSNAFKYTGQQGAITIKVFDDVTQFSFPAEKAQYKVEGPFELTDYMGVLITDTGVGISRESLPDIFNRFYQLKSASSQEHLGSGVGLALTKSLVTLHKGEIWVSSLRGAGTDFLVLLPKTDSYLLPDEKVESGPVLEKNNQIEMETNDMVLGQNIIEEKTRIQRKAFSVLIIEDNHEMRNFLKNKLIDDYIIYEAENGEVGLNSVYENHPDIVVTDVMMPVKDGIQMTRELKGDIETCHLPIIMLTARDAVNDQVIGVDAGADVYITKPFNFDFLKANIRNLITSRKKLIEKFAEDVLFEAKELGQNKRDKEFFDKLYHFIEQNLESAELDSELICRSLGVGRTTLFNKVKGLTDQSLGQFIRSIRLKTAAKFLIIENLTVSEAAFKVGITSPSYFSRAFKEQFGKTPREFIEHYSSKGKKE